MFKGKKTAGIHLWCGGFYTSKLPRRGDDDMRSGGERRNLLSGKRWPSRGVFLESGPEVQVVVWNNKEAAELSDRWKRNLSSVVGTLFPACRAGVISGSFDSATLSNLSVKQSLRDRRLRPRSVGPIAGSRSSPRLPRSKSWPQRSPWPAGSFNSTTSSSFSHLQSCLPIRLQSIRIRSSTSFFREPLEGGGGRALRVGWRSCLTDSNEGELDRDRERCRRCKRNWAGGRSRRPSPRQLLSCFCCNCRCWPTSTFCLGVIKRHLPQWTCGITSVRGSELTETYRRREK